MRTGSGRRLAACDLVLPGPRGTRTTTAERLPAQPCYLMHPQPRHRRRRGRHLLPPRLGEPAYALTTSDQPDPFHSDPSGEFIRIPPSETIGTATTMHLILGPGD